jgi:hypothetical protein
MWLGRPTKAQIAEWERNWSDVPVAYHRGEGANLGPTKPAKQPKARKAVKKA